MATPTVIYPFKETPVKVTHAVTHGIDQLTAVGVNRLHLLDIYLDALFIRDHQANHKQEIRNPYRYLKAVHGMTPDQRRITSHAFEKEFNATIEAWMNIEPLSFLSQYESYLNKRKNDSGLENGMVSARLFARVTPDMRLLIVNPSPNILSHIAGDARLLTMGITFAFEDDRHAQICGYHPWPNNINSVSLDQVDYSIPYAMVCIMGAGERYNAVCTVLQSIAASELHQKTKIFLYVPTAFIDRREKEDLLRQTINAKFDVLQIVLIDPSAARIEPTKRCMVVLRCKQHTPEEIPLEKIIRKGKSLEVRPVVRMPYCEFLECRKTLNTMYYDAKRHDARKNTASKSNKCSEKEPSRAVFFSDEIMLWYSTEKMRNGGKKTYRGVFRYYDFPTSKQQSTKKYNRGDALGERIVGKTVDSPDSVCDCVNDLIPNRKDLANLIRETVRKQFGSMPVSLKTAWYLLLDELNGEGPEDKRPNWFYDDALCRKLFLDQQWDKNPLCHLMVGESDEEDVVSAMAEFVAAHGVSNYKVEKIYAQLYIIWSLYLRRRKDLPNPIPTLLGEISNKNAVKDQLRSALVLRSLTKSQMQQLVSHLNNDRNDPVMALLVKFKVYLRISNRIAAALTIGDYIPRVAGYNYALLRISQEMYSSNADLNAPEKQTPFLQPWKNRQIPVPPFLRKPLDELVEHTKVQLLALGVPEAELGKYPLFPSPDPRTPLRTREINDYCNKMISRLQLPSIWLTSPEEDTSTNIGRYHYDLLLTNWEYHAAHAVGMDNDTISYVAGRKPDMVVNSNYRDFSHPLQQKALMLEFGKLVAAIEPPAATTNTVSHPVKLGSRRQIIPYTPQATPTELVIEVDLQQNTSLAISAEALHGCYIDITFIKEEKQSA